MRALPRVAFAAACVLLVVGCGDNAPGGPRTPEQVVATAKDGDQVVVEGNVHTLTFDSLERAEGETGKAFDVLPDRFLLLRTVVPPGVTLAEGAIGDLTEAWGLGVRIPGARLASAALPQIGDRVRVTGTFRTSSWNERQMPVVEDATLEVVAGAAPLRAAGAACSLDLQCHDRLICDRASSTCVAPPALDWGSDLRNLHGSCASDAECPLGQRCDDRYVVPTTGPYAPPYFVGRDGGKHLCVPVDGTTLDSACPRRGAVADLVGGRFVAGKEVCIEAEVWLPIAAEDGDTHLQLAVPEPMPYPEADAQYQIFGGTTENVPPYKDPSRPQGALADPEQGQRVVALGTVRYDDGHGWWELHPVKAYFVVDGAARALQARYPTHPGSFDWEPLEHEKETLMSPEAHERERRRERARARGADVESGAEH